MKAATVLSSPFEQVLLFGLKGGHDAHEEMVLILSLPLGQRRFSNFRYEQGVRRDLSVCQIGTILSLEEKDIGGFYCSEP